MIIMGMIFIRHNVIKFMCYGENYSVVGTYILMYDTR